MASGRKSSVPADPSHPSAPEQGAALAPRPRDVAHERLRFRGGNRVDFFDSGRSAFPAMLDAIGDAERSIDLEIYTLRADGVGHRFRDALIERARRGVEVRLVYDALGSLGIEAAFLESLRSEGVLVRPFNPLSRWARLLGPRGRIDAGAWSPRKRNHRKLLLLDQRIAFSGGLNLADEYDAPARTDGTGDAWRDTHVRVEGPLAHDYAEVFEETWRQTDGAPGPRTGSPSTESNAPVRAAVLADGRRRANRRTDHLFAELIAGARSHVRWTSPYFAPTRRVRRELERAAERGVRVEILTAGESDHALLRWSHHATVDRLLRAGVLAFEYVPAMMHAKTAVFDGRIAVVGSSNLDRQSLKHNFELNTVFDDPDVADRLDRMIESDLSHSTAITPEGLAARSLPERIRDRLAAALVDRLL